MTFRESETVAGSETSQSGVVSAEPKRKSRQARLVKDVLPIVKDEAKDKAVATVVELEQTPALSEEALKPSAAAGEDPVRLYRKEIGQVALRRALGSIPLAVARLLALVDSVRRNEVALDEVILLPEGGEPLPDEIKPMLAAFARIRRLEREIERLEAALAEKRRRSTATRANYHKWIAQNRTAIQGVLEGLPLKPALVDRHVADCRAHAQRLRETKAR